MPLKIGTKDVAALYLGNTSLSSVRLGNTQIQGGGGGGGVTPDPGLSYIPAVTTASALIGGARLAKEGYAGKLIRIQKSAGDTSQTDIGFMSNGLLDTAAVLAFTGLSTIDGTLVAKVYNQDASGNDPYQATAANMPVLTTDCEGQPTINFPSGAYLNFDVSINTAAASVFFLGSYSTGAIAQFGTTSLSLQGNSTLGGRLALGTSTSRTSTLVPYQNPSVITMSSGASALKLGQDDAVNQTSSPSTSNAVVIMRIGNSTTANTTMTGTMQLLAVYGAALNDTDVGSIRTNMKAMRSIAAKSKTLVITEDSLSAGQGSTFDRDRTYYALTDADIRENVKVYRKGKGGRMLSVAVTDYPTDVAMIFNPADTVSVVALLGGINDAVNGQTDAQIETSLQTYVSQARTTGYQKIALYVLPVAPPNNAAMDGFNAWVISNYATYGDALINFRNSAIGSGSAGNAQYYSDATHPNSAGYSVWSAYELANGLKTLLGIGDEPPSLMMFEDAFAADTANADLTTREGWERQADGGRLAQTTGVNSMKQVVGVAPDTAYYGPDLLSAKHAVEAVVATVSNSTTFLLNGRVIDGLNNVGIRRNGNQWQLYKVIGGVFTQLGTSPQEIVIGDLIRMEFDGDTVSCYRNGEPFIGSGPITLNAPELIAATRAGCVVRTSLMPSVSRIKMEALAA